MSDGPAVEFIRGLPKIELHRHLEGCVRPETVLDIAREHGLEGFPTELDGVRGMVTMAGQPADFPLFLERFKILRRLYVDEEVVRRVVREAIEDAARDKIMYVELRYNPSHFAERMGFKIERTIEWISDEATKTTKALGDGVVRVEFIATINRDYATEVAIPVVEAAIAGAGSHFVGVDIAGDEMGQSIARFAGIVRKAKSAGLGVTIHAGEQGPAKNVRDAIELFEAGRIGHGISVIEDDRVVALALEKNVTFEVCPTSNLVCGVVEDASEHPISSMGGRGLKVTLNTDDPAILGVKLSDEYALCSSQLGFESDDITVMNANALSSAFLSHRERTALAGKYSKRVAAYRRGEAV